MALPPRIPKKAKRATRWRSTAHLNHVRSFACAVCWSTTNIAAAHVRLGSHTGLGQKPDDWRTAPLCDGPHSNNLGQLGCHNRQHIVGEATFWRGQNVEALIADLIRTSPRRTEIERVQRERQHG